MLLNYLSRCSTIIRAHHRSITQPVRGYVRFQTEKCRLLAPTRRHPQYINLRFQFRYAREKPAKVKVKKEDFKRLMNLAAPEKTAIAVAVGCLLVSSVVTMLVPSALGKILDIIFVNEAGNEEKKRKLRNFGLILCTVFAIGGLANYARVYLFNTASLRMVNRLRSQVFRSMVKQETGWFDKKGTGELLNRLINDTYYVGQSLSQNLSDGLRSAIMLAAGTSMMVYTSPHLALVSSIMVPAVAGFAVIYGRYLRNITRQLLDLFANISKNAEERLGNMKTVRAFSKEDAECKAFESELNNALQLGYKEVKARSIFFGLTGFQGNSIIVAVLYYGGTLVMQGDLSIGALTSFILYAVYSGMSINGLSQFYTELNKGVGAAQRIWEIIDRKYEMLYNVGVIPNVTRPLGAVQFENVKFSFPGRPEVQILNSFNLIMSPGTSTAVVGRSGTGKSTIAMLLLRFYDPQEGRILLDGVDIKNLNPLWLRSQIGAVNQDPILFSGTIRENILYGLKPGTTISDEDFMRVVREAYVNEFTDRLPDGLNTFVGQRGVMLSGGQKQRVGIARALIRNPTILLLDEATSALDSLSEELVENALERAAKGRTVLKIAHRLSTIRNADKIALLENGVIVEEGRYVDLIARETGGFRELVRKQSLVNA